MSEKKVVKTVEYEYDENTIYGVYHVHGIHEFATCEIADYPKKGETFVQMIETKTENGVIVFSAAYPADSDYAQKRLS